MSRIYFHSEDDTAEVSGRERAYMGTFCSSLLLVSMGLDRSWPSDAARYRRLLPVSHYTQVGDDVAFMRSFSTWLCVGGDHETETFGLTTKTEPFTAALNTALAIGGDVVKLMARLHGQCELHAYVEGQHRAWLADIIDAGRASNVLRASMGWEAVVELLRVRNDTPVVTSYSVCDGFPNARIGGWTEDDDGEGFWALHKSEQWARALIGLRARAGLELKPDSWNEFYFGHGVTGFDVVAEADPAVPALPPQDAPIV